MNIAAPLRSRNNPFPGLRPFQEDEEHLFFGRESQVDAMVNTLATMHFLAVVGTSGSGKSSLVNCGLRPALHRGLMARAGTAWRMAHFRPGHDPLGALARALARDGVLFQGSDRGGDLSLAAMIRATLDMSKLGLIDIYEQARLGENANLLVIADQFEELFRYRHLRASHDEPTYAVAADATAFVNLLLEVREQTRCAIYVVLTMRSDFLGDCVQFPGLPEAINAGQYLVPRLTRDERRAAIGGPVRVGGATISPVLLTRLVNDVGDNPDQLSILQHALNRTWARWQEEGSEGALELAHYEAIGTMAHALDQHAEHAYAELGTARQRQICQKLFKGLTDKATDPRGVRRPTAHGTLCALAGAAAVEITDVIDVFREPSRSFLMPPAGEELSPDTVIDISHESLMRVWERLRKWAEEEAQSARLYRRLAETAMLHAEGRTGLSRDPELQLALEWRDKEQPTPAWAERYHEGFEGTMQFLEASVAHREEEVREQEAQQQRALEQAQALAEEQRRRTRLAFAGAAISTTLLVLALGATVWALHATSLAGQRAADLERDYTVAVETTKNLVQVVTRNLPSGRITADVARELQTTAESVVNQFSGVPDSAPLRLQRIELLSSLAGGLLVLGDTQAALDPADSALRLSLDFHNKEPSDNEWSSQVMARENLVGDVLIARAETIVDQTAKRNLEQEALSQYRQSLDIARSLVQADPASLRWRRDLSISHNKVGDALIALGELRDSRVEYDESLAIMQKLVVEDPHDSSFQNDEAFSYEKHGDILVAEGEPVKALDDYNGSLKIVNDLLKPDPNHGGLRSHQGHLMLKIGDVLKSRNEFASAAQKYQEAKRIVEALVKRDPSNAYWRKDLLDCNERLSVLAGEQGDRTGTR